MVGVRQTQDLNSLNSLNSLKKTVATVINTVMQLLCSFVSRVRHLRNLPTSSGKNQRVNHLDPRHGMLVVPPRGDERQPRM